MASLFHRRNLDSRLPRASHEQPSLRCPKRSPPADSRTIPCHDGAFTLLWDSLFPQSWGRRGLYSWSSHPPQALQLMYAALNSQLRVVERRSYYSETSGLFPVAEIAQEWLDLFLRQRTCSTPKDEVFGQHSFLEMSTGV